MTSHASRRNADGSWRSVDDDDRGLRRLLVALGLHHTPPPEPRTIVRLRWHRAGVARSPVLCAVVQTTSTWELLEHARQETLRAEDEKPPSIRRGSPEAQDSTGGRDCTWRQYDVWADRISTAGFFIREKRGYGAGDR